MNGALKNVTLVIPNQLEAMRKARVYMDVTIWPAVLGSGVLIGEICFIITAEVLRTIQKVQRKVKGK
jgi:hypothetical protein